LPTEHDLGLPFHVNADFFPNVERKRVLFGSDYQAQWNRLAISGAAHALAANVERLTELLGPVPLWTLIRAVKAASDRGDPSEAAGAFWEFLAGRLRSSRTVFTTREKWSSPEGTHLLQASSEATAIGILNDLSIELVHEDLRPFQTLIRETLGVPILEVSHVAKALDAAGFSQRRMMSAPENPELLRTEQGWQDLWTELDVLISRRKAQPYAKAADDDIGAARSVHESGPQAPRYCRLLPFRPGECSATAIRASS